MWFDNFSVSFKALRQLVSEPHRSIALYLGDHISIYLDIYIYIILMCRDVLSGLRDILWRQHSREIINIIYI